MALTSMKMDGDDGLPCCAESNPYGYGLSICLSEEQVEALGLDANPPAAGSTVTLRAIAMVRSVTQEAELGDAEEDGETNKIDVRMTLQITDMEVTPGGQAGQAATVLYGNQ